MATGTVICLGLLGYQLQSFSANEGRLVQTDVSPAALAAATSPGLTVSPSPSLSATPAPSVNSRSKTVSSKLLKAYAVPHNGLITNEYAFFNPHDPASVISSDWEMTSGSLFGRDGAFWTGVPDENEPNAKSTNATNSAVFRLDSRQKYAGNIRVSLALMQLANIGNAGCNDNDTCWHGTHVWLRYQTEYNLYYASVNRADGQVTIKRKVPCGDDNDGTYFVLGSYVPHSFKSGAWNHYQVTIQTNFDKSVTIKLYDANVSTTKPVTVGTDRGGTNPNWSKSCSTPGKYASARYTPITAAGGIGIRGDYANFLFKDLTVSKL